MSGMPIEVAASLAVSVLTLSTLFFRGGRVVQEVSTLACEVQSLRRNVQDMSLQLTKLEAACPYQCRYPNHDK